MIESIFEVLKQGMAIALLFNSNVAEINSDLYNDVPLYCMAQNIYHEARGESRKGQIGVAFVTINRVKHSNYPDDICGVVHQGPTYTNWKGNEWPIPFQCQFTWDCDGRSDDIENVNAWNESVKVAAVVMTGLLTDPTHGATHYYNPKKASPNWGFPITAYIGDHAFCKMPSTT